MANINEKSGCFRPHVWGFFFHFFGRTATLWMTRRGFRPHVWGFFFHLERTFKKPLDNTVFSSPCMGILFSHDGATLFKVSVALLFSSPCMGILFSRGGRRHYRHKFPDCFRPHVWGFFFHSRSGRPHRMGSLWPFCGGDFQLIRILIIFTL